MTHLSCHSPWLAGRVPKAVITKAAATRAPSELRGTGARGYWAPPQTHRAALYRGSHVMHMGLQTQPLCENNCKKRAL